MKVRMFMLLTVMGLSQAAVANNVCCNGFYLGADVGVANFMDKEAHIVNPESHKLGAPGAIGGGYVGYDYGINCITRIAIEGFVDATGLQTSIKHSSDSYRMNQRYNVGIRLLPTYLFTPCTMGHLVVGYANGQFQIKDNGVYGLINKTYHKNGFQLGAGFTTALPNNFFLRLDALYNSYRSNTDKGKGLPGASKPYQIYKNRFSQLAGELSLYYKFV